MGIELFTVALAKINYILWDCINPLLILMMGLFFVVRSRCFHVRKFFSIFAYFFRTIFEKNDGKGIHPIKVFFASLGGCIGIGNLVGVCEAINYGGPGVLFWMWVVAFLGIPLKYAEIFLGVKYRKQDSNGRFRGGAMYFLERAFSSRWVPKIFAACLCIYGVEIFMFDVIKDSVVNNAGLPHELVIMTLLMLVLVGSCGGVKRIANINSFFVPVFMLIFVAMVCWILLKNIESVPGVLVSIIDSAFCGKAAVGGFIGTSVSAAISYGFQIGCYSGDIGVGYASIIHSETSCTDPRDQAKFAVVDIFLDSFVATLTGILIMITGVWTSPSNGSSLIQKSLSMYFSYMTFFMPLFLFMLGYSTIISYFCIAMKCARFLSTKWGEKLFLVYACSAFVIFSFIDVGYSFGIMMVVGGFLIFINLIAIFRLRKDINFY